MEFEKYIAIDWSGASKSPNDAIQIAEYIPRTRRMSIVRSCNQSPTGWNIWSREEVLRYVQREIKKGRVLIGFDFAFGYPYCDYNAYFPDCGSRLENVQDLWATVDRFCKVKGGRDFYGWTFYKDRNSPFRRYFHFKESNKVYEGDRYKPRLRVTDRRAIKPAGRRPSSVFTCDYATNVGTGTLAGMRILHELQQDVNVAIWPFKTSGVSDPPDSSTVVEIYPRLFLNHAEQLHSQQNRPNTVRNLLKCYGTTLNDACEKWSDHERDALVSAAGMSWFADQQETWRAPTRACTCATTYEGWMFGLQVATC